MESWPLVEEPLRLTPADVSAHLRRVRDLCAGQGLDALVITSSDQYLNEYTPPKNNHRLVLSGFTGSTAFLVIPLDGRARLLVDGRYYIQADQEVNTDDVEVIKVPFGTLLTSALADQVRRFSRVGYEADRISKSLADSLAQVTEVRALPEGCIDLVLPKLYKEPTKPLSFIPDKISGRPPRAKLGELFSTVARPESTAILLSALDDLAWISDARGYHFAHQSSFAGCGLALHNAAHLLVHRDVLASARRGALDGVLFSDRSLADEVLLPAFDRIDTLIYDASQTTPARIQTITTQRPKWKLVAQSSPVIAARARKTREEVAHLEESNRRSCQAVTETIRWVRTRFAKGERVDEHLFYETANQAYADVGARDLSFHTISAIGSDSAIIHFSNPSRDVVAAPDDLMLLDSGALYEGGFATDITRTFLAAGRRARASARQMEIYTLVLQGLLRGMKAVFPEGTRGSFLDALVRAPLYEAGYDYGHGTGHGVGIHVHEPGVSISPLSNLALRAGYVSSIEPGIYIPGFGGVRLENVVVFENDLVRPGFLCSRPLNYVGFDENLIDRDRLDPRELTLLDLYQDECRRRGTLDFEFSAP